MIVIKKITIGLLSHVDAGKTTLSEAFLYDTGTIHQLGRVDNRDSYLDNFSLEKEKGITIFSKMAVINYNDMMINLLDTPGHIDFSSEMERTLQVLDYAILIVSALDGVQAHTETLWKLLNKYKIPVFIFINKMDICHCNKSLIIENLKSKLSDKCIDFCTSPEKLYEDIGLSNENALNEILDTNKIEDKTIIKLITERQIYPCFFGSALKNEGIENLLNSINRYTESTLFSEEFSAKVYKISRDSQGNRLTFLKILGGFLKVKNVITYHQKDDNSKIISEKVNMIRRYSGNKYESLDKAIAGDICAVIGFENTFPGQNIGSVNSLYEPIFEPVLIYRIILPQNVSSTDFLQKLKKIEEEFPEIMSSTLGNDLYIHILGEIQLDAIRKLVYERYGITINYSDSRIIYKETISDPVEGVGHFEPLKHYAEIHLLLEPGEPGSGITAFSNCNNSVLDTNWQRLCVNHILEKQHVGVLTGSPLTDVKISVIAGRASVKHTEGGDFRQAVYRAIRQGLMKTKSILLEPYYFYTITVPTENLGRAVSDIKLKSGTISTPETKDEISIIKGRVPVSEMNNYYSELLSYSKGKGKLSLIPDGYSPCHNSSQIINSYKYNPENDINNSPDSVFCSHGTSEIIKWNNVEKYMHVSSGLNLSNTSVPFLTNVKLLERNLNIDEKELEEIMIKEFGPIKRRHYSNEAILSEFYIKNNVVKKDYLIIDGYNLVFAWDLLRNYSNDNFDGARHLLCDILANYRGYTESEILLVFDAYKVKENTGEKYDYNGIHVLFTKENETGDMYIEKLINEIGKNYKVKVVTSDNLIQISATRGGVLRLSSREFIEELNKIESKINKIINDHGKKYTYKPFENLNILN